MSDLYLVLRERIGQVAENVAIPTEQLEQAQKARGLSNERMGWQISVSEKTWRRWKKTGQVPVHSFQRVAEVLRLEIVRPEFDPVEVALPPESLADVVAELRDALAEARAVAERLLELERERRTPRDLPADLA